MNELDSDSDRSDRFGSEGDVILVYAYTRSEKQFVDLSTCYLFD